MHLLKARIHLLEPCFVSTMYFNKSCLIILHMAFSCLSSIFLALNICFCCSNSTMKSSFYYSMLRSPFNLFIYNYFIIIFIIYYLLFFFILIKGHSQWVFTSVRENIPSNCYRYWSQVRVWQNLLLLFHSHIQCSITFELA